MLVKTTRSQTAPILKRIIKIPVFWQGGNIN